MATQRSWFHNKQTTQNVRAPGSAPALQRPQSLLPGSLAPASLVKQPPGHGARGHRGRELRARRDARRPPAAAASPRGLREPCPSPACPAPGGRWRGARGPGRPSSRRSRAGWRPVLAAPSPVPGHPHPPPASAGSTSSSAAIAFIGAAAQAHEHASEPADGPTGRPRAAAALKTAPPAHASSARTNESRARPHHRRRPHRACAPGPARSPGRWKEGQPSAAEAEVLVPRNKDHSCVTPPGCTARGGALGERSAARGSRDARQGWACCAGGPCQPPGEGTSCTAGGRCPDASCSSPSRDTWEAESLRWVPGITPATTVSMVSGEQRRTQRGRERENAF